MGGDGGQAARPPGPQNKALGLWYSGRDMDGGHQECRRGLAGQTGALASSWVKEVGPWGERS